MAAGADLDAGFWIDLAWKVASVAWAGFFFPLWRGQDRANTRADTQDGAIRALSEKLTKLDGDIKALPTDVDVDGLKKDIGDLGQKLAALPTDEAITNIYKMVNHEVGQLHEKVNEVAGDLNRLAGRSERDSELLKAIHHKIMSGV